MTDKHVAISEPTLPGLISNTPVADLLQVIGARYDGAVLVARRLPTALERQMLQVRRADLDRVLQPIGSTAAGSHHLKHQILTRWFGAYPKLAYADVEMMLVSYTDILSTLPEFAVVRALRKIANGTAMKRDAKGVERPLDPDEPPGALYIRQLAQKEAEAAYAEMTSIDKALVTRKTEDADAPTEAQRQRIKAGLDALSDGLKRGLRADKASGLGLRAGADENEIQEAEQRRQKIAREQAEKQSERMILDEYEGLNLKPLYTGDGTIISPQMARACGLHMEPKTKGRGGRG